MVFTFYNLNLLTISNNQDYARIDKSKGEDSVVKIATTGIKITNKIRKIKGKLTKEKLKKIFKDEGIDLADDALLVLFCGLVSILGSWLSIAWLVSCPRVVAKSLVLLRLMLAAVRLVLWWVVCWLLLVLESREMLPLKPPEFPIYKPPTNSTLTPKT
jgi:hypothetical protein